MMDPIKDNCPENPPLNGGQMSPGSEELSLDRLELIIHMICGDFGIKVRWGKPGHGSFYHAANREIVLDPTHVDLYHFHVAAHEAAHVAITVFPDVQDYPSDAPKLAYHFIWNCLEDTSIESWLSGKYPGLREMIKRSYRDLDGVGFGQDDSGFDDISAQVLGRKKIPMILQLAKGIFKHMLVQLSGVEDQGFGADLDQRVVDSLQRVGGSLVTVMETVPDPKNIILDRRDVRDKGKERLRIIRDEIWPEFRQLLEQDIQNQAISEMVKDIMRTASGCGNGGYEMREDSTPAGCESEAKGRAGIRLSTEAQSELKEASERSRQQVLDALREQLTGQEAELSRLEALRTELESDLEKLPASNCEASDQKSVEDELRENNDDLQRLLREIERRRKQVEQIREAIDEILARDGQSIQLEELSPKTRKELMDAFSELPQEYKNKLLKRAEEKISELLDKLNEQMKPKLIEGSHPAAEEQSPGEYVDSPNTETQQSPNQQPQAGLVSPSVKIVQRNPVDLYQHSRSELDVFMDGLHGLAADLRGRIERILTPQDSGEEERGFPYGQILDIPRAMQAEVNPLEKRRLWTRFSAPSPGDYSFFLVIDLSGSMSGEKVKETIKGAMTVALAIEPLERKRSGDYGVRLGIVGFHNDLFPIKRLGETHQTVYQSLYEARNRVNDENSGTNTLVATEYALSAIRENPARNCNFILTFTDGEPNHDVRDGLKRVLAETLVPNFSECPIQTAVVMLGESDSERVRQVQLEYGYHHGFALPAVNPNATEGLHFPTQMANLIRDLLLKIHVR